jgi:alpha-beta hydrolase superfamily lysophospholipase
MAFAIALTGLILMFGPRPQLELYTRFKPPEQVGSLDDWLAEREARVPNLRPGLEKEIVWADPEHRRKTAIAVVYIHGFSASKEETRPLTDQIARELGANIFFTRLAGHGADSEALGAATAEQWLDDVAEALWIGSRIGERTVVIATSTGATLATPLLADPALSRQVAAAVFISPNFGLKAMGTSLLTAPFARRIAHMMIGAERVVTPVNAAQEKFWTLRYPVEALLPMAALVKAVRRMDLSRVKTPTLFYYSRQDQVVDPGATESVYDAWGGPTAKAMPGPVEDPWRHVLAGDALSPSGTAPAATKITNWLRTQLKI